MVERQTSRVLCTNFCNGKKHDFKLFKDSKIRWVKKIGGIVDSGHTGIKHLQSSSQLPKKRTKKNPLTKDEKQMNRKIASERVLNEDVIGRLKRFRILSDKYRNRRKRFGLRFNLIVGIYNREVGEDD